MHTEVALHSMNAYVWCLRKACGALDEIPSVTMGTCKRKFLMNSNMTLTVLNLHQQTGPKVQQDFKGQYSKVKGQSVLHHNLAHLLPPTNVLTKYQLPTPYSFRNIAQTTFYRSRSLRQGSKVKSKSHYDVAHLHPLTNVPTKYQLPTPYSC